MGKRQRGCIRQHFLEQKVAYTQGEYSHFSQKRGASFFPFIANASTDLLILIILSLQAASPQSTIMLSDVSNVERVDLKLYCLVVETPDRRVYLSLKSDEEVYGWQDDIYQRTPLVSVGQPTNFVHKVHVGFDPVSGGFTVRTFTLSLFSFHGNRLIVGLLLSRIHSPSLGCAYAHTL